MKHVHITPFKELKKFLTNLPTMEKIQPGKHVVIDEKGKVLKVLTITGNKCRCDQSYKDLCNLKSLVLETETRGLMRASAQFNGELDDYPDYDFQEAQIMMAKARSKFEAMPSKIRIQFDNDPAKFLDFAGDPKNQKAMIDLGLAHCLDGFDKNGKPLPITKTPPTEVTIIPHSEEKPATS